MAAPLERTLLIIKPDAVRRNLNFQIADRFEKRSFTLIACKMLQPSRELAERHYAPLKSSTELNAAVEMLISGPVIVMLFEAPGALSVASVMLGDSDPAKAEIGTIRGDFAISSANNLVESSLDKAEADRTTALWFTADEIIAAPRSEPSANDKVADHDTETPDGGKSKRALAKEAKKLEKSAKKEANKKQSAGIPAQPAADKPKIEYEPPSGTRDFFPEEMRERNW